MEAWTEPELFGMDFQAGAPPDEFSDLGQNWEFPTYNWEVMQANDYDWWKKRFNVIARYFDAMRIDPVSYTHLDVYKRQRKRCENGSNLSRSLGSGCRFKKTKRICTI